MPVFKRHQMCQLQVLNLMQCNGASIIIGDCGIKMRPNATKFGEYKKINFVSA